MGEIEIKLNADVSKVVDLVENEAITKEDGKDMLNQFGKDDLIEALLNDDDIEDIDWGTGEDSEDSDKELPKEELEATTMSIKEAEVKEVTKEEPTKVIEDELLDDEDDDFEVLD